MPTLARPRPATAIATHLARNPQHLERIVRSKWLLCRNFSRGQKSGLPAPLFVSLTSYPPRFGTLATTIKSLLMQSCAPDGVLLWIAEGDRAKLPGDVLALRAYGLEIRTCADLRSYKKIVPAVRQQPNAFWVTADDDCYYPPHWLKALVRAWAPYSREAICHRAHRIRVDAHGRPLPYLEWELELDKESAHPLNFMTGVGGVLYPPNCFPPEVVDEALFRALAPACDDVWLWWMLRKAGFWVRKIGGHWPIVHWEDSQISSLYSTNVLENGNDDAVAKMISHFGFPGPHPADAAVAAS